MELEQQPINKMKTVFIGMPSHHGETPEKTQRSLDALIQYSGSNGVKMLLSRTYGSILPRNRNECVVEALKHNADYLLFIDSDMVFDRDALMKLLKYDRDVVSALCVSRYEPFIPTTKKKNSSGRYEPIQNLTEGRFYSDLDVVGMAFVLIKMDVFRKVNPPWFAMPPLELLNNYYGLVAGLREMITSEDISADKIKSLIEKHDDNCKNSDLIGEDYYCSEKIRNKGIEICCDTSLIVGHIGEYIYTINDYLNYKAEREARENAG